MKPPVLVQGHTCLGDCINFSGIVAYLSKYHEHVMVGTYDYNLPSVRSLYAPHPNVTVFGIPQLPNETLGLPSEATYNNAIEKAGFANVNRLRIGSYNSHAGHGVQSCFQQAGIPYNERWGSNPITEAAKYVEQVEWDERPYRIFLHDDVARNFVISAYKDEEVFRPSADYTKSILRYVKMLQTADVIALIDSAFLHVVEFIETAARKEFHAYVRADPSTIRTIELDNRKSWTILYKPYGN